MPPCATGSGCFPGDSQGLPVEIDTPGSYVLTSSLASTGSSAISISSPQVTLDLAGFQVACLAAAAFDCIETDKEGTTIRNGSNIMG